MEAHRTKHEAREHLLRSEGFKDFNYKYGVDYNFYENVDKEYAHKYNTYRERYYETLWDTKANHEYYSKPAYKRAWIQLKKVISFYRDFIFVWGFLALGFSLYNAHTTSKKLNISYAYL
jgi:hypothetical protein